MEPMAYHAFRSMIFSNIEMGLKVKVEDKEHAEKKILAPVQSDEYGQAVVGKSATGTSTGQQMIFPSDAFSSRARAEFYAMLGEDDEVVNVITIAGPMTRGGGACSYGSLDHRDLIMEAANVPQVKAHILITRTPGGMASTLRDYRMAVNYAHARGQKVYMLCDGDVASGGAFTGTICDGIYAVNPDDQIGSLGMYCAFFTNKDGDKDAVSQETYHEYYASKSKDKNAWYRAAADDDMSLIAEEVERDLDQLLANVRADRPKVKKDQLTGKMYRMGDVKGSLIDGFATLDELALMAFKEWHKRGGAVVPAKMGGTVKGKVEEKDGVVVAQQQTESTHEGAQTMGNDSEGAPVEEEGTKVQTLNTQEQMKNYPNLGRVAGLEDALEQQADGYVSLTEEQADTMEAAIDAATTANATTQNALTEANAKVEELTNEKAEMQKQLDEANTKVEELQGNLTAKEEELANAQASAQTAASEAQTAHETALAEANAHAEELQKQLDEARQTIASREATIADLNTTIAELNESAGGKQNGGGAPQNNGKGAEAPTYSQEGRYDATLSPAENKKRIEAYNKKLEKMAAGAN